MYIRGLIPRKSAELAEAVTIESSHGICYSFTQSMGVDEVSALLSSCTYFCRYRGSYMSDHVLLNLLDVLRKRNTMEGLPGIFISFSQQI